MKHISLAMHDRQKQLWWYIVNLLRLMDILAYATNNPYLVCFDNFFYDDLRFIHIEKDLYIDM